MAFCATIVKFCMLDGDSGGFLPLMFLNAHIRLAI